MKPLKETNLGVAQPFFGPIKETILTNERALLGLFMAKIHKIDPDVLVVCLFATFSCLPQ